MADGIEIVHCAEMPWGESLVAQRGTTAGMAHKRLFEGEEDSPDNYMLVMSREPKTYFSPRHRHPWDQIRFCLEGKIPIAKGLYIEGGEIGYFPEAAHYGPQEGGEDRIVLLLQFGGASGQGFIGPERLKQARLELAETGTFERGAYTTDTDGHRSNRDAYEAVWEHVKGAAARLCRAGLQGAHRDAANGSAVEIDRRQRGRAQGDWRLSPSGADRLRLQDGPRSHAGAGTATRFALPVCPRRPRRIGG